MNTNYRKGRYVNCRWGKKNNNNNNIQMDGVPVGGLGPETEQIIDPKMNHMLMILNYYSSNTTFYANIVDIWLHHLC